MAGPLSPVQPAAAVPTIQPKASPGGGLTLQNGQISFTAFYCRSKGVPPGATQTYTVPANTHSVYVDAVGGAGQTPNPNQTGYGGQAGEVTGGLNVTPGEKLPVDVGCQGSSGGGPSAFAPGGARGKGDSGVTPCCYFDSYSGGGGGGASAVLMPNRAPLVVAGGGGGAAGDGGSCVRYDIVVTVFECDNGPDGDGGNGGYGDSSGTDSSGGIGSGNPNPAAADGDNCPAAGGVAVAGQKGQDLVLSGPLNQQGTLQGAGGAGGGGGGGYSGPGIGGGACGGSAGGQNPDFGSNTVRVYSFPAGNGGGGGASWASGSVDSSTTDLADVGGDGFVLFITSADGVRKHNFNYAGSKSQYFCVPDGVDELFAEALGGAGAGAGSGFHGIGNGGAGAGVQAVVPVAERTQLQVLAGEFGHGGGGFGAGHGGSHGISDDEKTGAGGGGSSGLFSTTEECGAKFNHNKPSGRTTLVVAGGGGGGGGNGGGTGGGNGGTGGTPQGGNGQAGSGYTGGNPGGCGGVPIGGQPINCGEAANGSTRGGDGTHANTGGGGGGGGGGYLGGGKGRGAAGGTDGGGSGGGGGASYVTSHTPQAPHYYLGPSGNLSNHDHLDDGHIDLVVPVPTHRSQVQVVSGNEQSAYPGQPFSAPLIARYVDAINGPQGRVPVILQLDPSNGGPAAVFPNGKSSIQLTTNQQGRVSTTLTSVTAGTAHRAAGAFKVDAYAANDPAHLITAANFVLHNSALPTTVTLTSSSPDNSPINGQPFHVMAQVAVSPGIHNTWGTPTGTVQFSVDQ
ncbi:MAG TPA: hypothetical protein VG205_08960, partial [Acidimicrobiales bacterium]|nr:hypothetical protein [Acidimicrobiales bacterium]